MTNNEIENNYERKSIEVSVVTIVVNALLAGIKFLAGIFGNSSAMISDAIHSLSDVLSSFFVIIGVKIGNKSIDDSHQYGHEKFESIAALFLACMLLFAGLGIGYVGLEKIWTKEYEQAALPSDFALYAAIVSIVIKEAMYWYTLLVARKIKSDILLADAWHHRSDALSSVGSFIGIYGAMLGYPLLDPLASVVICLFIIKVSYEILHSALDKITDKAIDKKSEEEIREFILKNKDVLGIDSFKSRIFSNKIYLDVEILVDANMPTYLSHEIAENVHDELEENFENIKHCMVHVNPSYV